MDDIKKIAVWQTAFLGDAVLTLPLIKALKDRFPGAGIHYWVRAGLEPLFKYQPQIERVHGFDKRGREKGLGAAWSLGRSMSAMGFDLLVSAHTSARSALVVRASAIPARVGYDSPWWGRLAYTATVDREFGKKDEIERLMNLARPLGVSGPAPWPEIVLDPAAQAFADDLFKKASPGPVLGLHPGSTWPTKRWPAKYYGQIISLAAAYGVRVMVFAGPGEEAMAREALDGADADPAMVTDLSGKLSLPRLAACLKRLDAYLCNDSGPMHLAWMQRTPLVSLFGPTTRDLGFFPRGETSVVLQCDLDCRPCGLHGPKACPRKHHRCMADLDPERVWVALKKLLAL